MLFLSSNVPFFYASVRSAFLFTERRAFFSFFMPKGTPVRAADGSAVKKTEDASLSLGLVTKPGDSLQRKRMERLCCHSPHVGADFENRPEEVDTHGRKEPQESHHK